MKVLIVTQADPFYLPHFFKSFFDEFSKKLSGVDIIGVVLQRPLGKRSKKALLHSMIDFYGPVVFTVMSMKYILQRLENKLNKMGLIPAAHSIEYFCHKQGIRIMPYRNVNHPGFIEFVRNNRVDLIISVAASQIFRSEILNAPRLGCVNIHNAPLPEYRGMMPTFWQMFHGERQVIATIHEMNEEIDKGRIILKVRTEIDKGVTLDALIKKTRMTDAKALVKVLALFQENRVEYFRLPRKKGSYFSFPTRRDVVEFRKRGYRII